MKKNNKNDLIRCIWESINRTIDEKLKRIHRDITYEGRIVSSLENDGFIVKINGQEYSCYSLSSDASSNIKVGSIVWVLSPKGDINTLLILGEKKT